MNFKIIILKKYLLALMLSAICTNLIAQNQISPKYSVDNTVNALANYGDTLIVGGDFNNVGIYSGAGAMFTTNSDQPNLNFPKIIGTIKASTADGNGGYYIYGVFKKESEVTNSFPSKRIEHILPNLSFEPNFSIPVNALFDIECLLFNNSKLFIGGSYVTAINSQPAGDLSVLNTVTQILEPWIPTITHSNLGGVFTMCIFANTLYVAGGFTAVGDTLRDNIAAVEIGTGLVKPWNFSAALPANSLHTFASILKYNSQLVIGGNFGTNSFPTNHACALVDTLSGQSVNYLFTSGGLFGAGNNYLYFAAGVSSMCISGDTLFTFTGGTFDTRVTALLLPSGNAIWGKYFNMIAKASNLAVKDGELFVAGSNFDKIYVTNLDNSLANFESDIKAVVKLNTATGNLMPWFPNPVGLVVRDVYTMGIHNNNVCIGGVFTHVNGIKRNGVVMIKNSTQEILPVNINLGSHTVKSLKVFENTLYAAGNFPNVDGVAGNRSVLALNLLNGSLLPWHPPYLGVASAVEANSSIVYVGGNLTEPSGGQNRQNLFSINRNTGSLNNWAPNPNSSVLALHINDDKLYVGGDFTNIMNTSKSRIARFDIGDLSLNSWAVNINGTVRTITSNYDDLWIGGNFYNVNNENCSLIAGVEKNTTLLKHKPVSAFNFGTVFSIIAKGCKVVAGGNFRLNTDSCNNLFVYDIFDKAVAPTSSFCNNIDDLAGNVFGLTTINNSLYFAGSFTKTNAKTNAVNIERYVFGAGFFNTCVLYETTQNGNWNTPATWLGGIVPPASARVIIKHSVSVTVPASCFSLLVIAPGNLALSNNLTIYN